MKFNFILSFVVAFSVAVAEAKDEKIENLRLEQYFAEPIKDFSWMNDEEKAKYVSFILNLNLFLETELSRGTILMTTEPQKYESHFKWQNEFIKELFEIKEVQALVPLALVPFAGAALGTVVRAGAPFVSRQLALRGTFDVAEAVILKETPKAIAATATWFQRLTSSKAISLASNGASAAYIVSESASVNPDVARPTPANLPGPGTSLAAPNPAASFADQSRAGSVVQLNQQLAQAASEDSPIYKLDSAAKKQARDPAAASGARTEGSFCIFGGYGSRYKVVGGRAFCPGPVEMINNTLCAAKKINPSFLCQSFGLSTSLKEPKLSDNLCIPLRSDQGLKDLTVRCTKAFIEFAERAKGIDAKKLSEIQNQVLKGITALETERGINDVGLLGYCKDENKTNRGAQKSECKALVELTEKYKKDFKTIVAAAAAAPAARSNRASPGPAPASR